MAALAAAFTSSTHAIASDIPKKKISQAGLYVTSAEAVDFLHDETVVFLDIRSRAEVSFLGLPTRVNVHIPYMVLPEFPIFDEKKGTYKLQLNPDFLADFENYVMENDLSRDTRFLLMCRSGSRSARAASLLYKRGFPNVYSLLDGYEGDKAKNGPSKGKRTVNGWRNVGLDWSYKIQTFQVYPSDKE